MKLTIALSALFSLALSLPALNTAGAEEAAPSVWKEMFPEGLTDAEGKDIDLASLEGKVVGLYFSAHWCPPCRAFTPGLVEFRDANKDNFEVVFVSCDRSQEQHAEYITWGKMKWLCVKFQSETAKKLMEKHEVRGIPALVILSHEGEVVTKDGRGDIQADPSTALSKWTNGGSK